MIRVISANLKTLLLAIGGFQVVLGLYMVTAPGSFFEEIGTYGERNDHYTRDAGTFTVALGVVLFASAFRPRWRAAALLGALVQYALHAVNHLFDVGVADPESLGIVNFLLLATGAVLLGAMLAAALRADSEVRST